MSSVSEQLTIFGLVSPDDRFCVYGIVWGKDDEVHKD